MENLLLLDGIKKGRITIENAYQVKDICEYDMSKGMRKRNS